jgi:protein-tyrosine-phosphatase
VLAAALLEAAVDRSRLGIVSYGTLNLGPRPALPETIDVGDSLGVDVRRHRARALPPGALAATDLIVGFEPAHIAAAVAQGRADVARSFLLLELADLLDTPPRLSAGSGDEQRRLAVQELHRRRNGDGRSSLSLPDPYGEPRRVYAETGRVIDAVVNLVVASLFADLSLDGTLGAAVMSASPSGDVQRGA